MEHVDVLRSRYEALDLAKQEAFLDIGCFLAGEVEKLAIEVLEGLHDIPSEDCLERLRIEGFVDATIACRQCGRREDPMHGDNYCCGSLKAITMPDRSMVLARDLGENATQPQPLRLASSIEMDTFLMNVPSEFQKWGSSSAYPRVYKIWGIRFSKQPAFREGIRVKAEGLRLFVAKDLPKSFFDWWTISGELLWLRLFNLRGSLRFPPSISLKTLRVLELEGPPHGVQQFMRNSACDAGRRKSIFDFWPIAGSGRSIFSIWKRHSVFRYLKGKSRVTGMELDLTNLELKNIKSLQSLPIKFSLFPKLTTLDVSGCVGLTALPSTNKKLSQLHYLRCLKFLNINKCSNLKTLNVKDLTSLEEIQADACWKLEEIVDFSLRDRLNCLHISTDNSVIWTNITTYLSQQKPSTAIFSGRADNNMVVDAKQIKDEIWTAFRVHIGVIAFSEYLNEHVDVIMILQRFSVTPKKIMMFFIIDAGQNDATSPELRLTFTPTNNGIPGSALKYRTALANRGGRSLNVFMWTEGSHLFKENNADGIHVSCFDQNHINKGWIVTAGVDNNTFPQVCAEIIRTLLKK